MKKKFPFFKQYDRTDCGPTCLKMLAKFYGKTYSSEYLSDLCNITQEGISVMGMTEAAEKIGFHSLVASINFETLKNQAPLPCVVYWRQRHFVIVYKIDKNKVYVADPEFGLITYTEQKFNEAWQNTKHPNDINEGLAIFFEPSSEFDNIKEVNKKSAGFSSLLPYIKPYKKYALQIIVGFTIVSIIQLILPFLTQSVVDKGINYREFR